MENKIKSKLVRTQLSKIVKLKSQKIINGIKLHKVDEKIFTFDIQLTFGQLMNFCFNRTQYNKLKLKSNYRLK